MSYVFHPAAEAEYLESIAYYESKIQGLGAAFLSEFELVMSRVCEAPGQNPIKCQPDIRCVVLKRFPFNVLYREINGSVQVLAIAHYRRRPNFWLGRL